MKYQGRDVTSLHINGTKFVKDFSGTKVKFKPSKFYNSTFGDIIEDLGGRFHFDGDIWAPRSNTYSVSTSFYYANKLAFVIDGDFYYQYSGYQNDTQYGQNSVIVDANSVTIIGGVINLLYYLIHKAFSHFLTGEAVAC